MIKKIGVLTSGGDCAGLNMVLKAITEYATRHYGWEVTGIRRSTQGLLENPFDVINLTPHLFQNTIAFQGGTFLGSTTRGTPDQYPLILENFKKLGIDALIGIGGDGSLKILHNIFSVHGIPFIGVPKTIDNDLGCTQTAIGFQSAVDVATEALDRLQPTAASHDRIMVLEVMGRDAGHIALHAGIAGGADAIIIPEIPYTLEALSNHLKEIFDQGRSYALVVVTESVKTEDGKASQLIDVASGSTRYGGIGHYFSHHLSETLNRESRFMVLGHVQRGVAPNASDRILAATFGIKAVELLAEGKTNRMVAWQNNTVTDIPLLDAIADYRYVDIQSVLVKTARGLGISFGD